MTEPQTSTDAKKPPRAAPNKAKITRPFVSKLKREPPTEAMTWWHTGLPGFGVTAYPDGNIAYPVRYSIGRGCGRKQRQLTLPGTLPPNEAEKQARIIQNDALKGIDPLQQRRDQAAAVVQRVTYADLVTLFIEEQAKPTQRTWNQTRGCLLGPRADPFPWLTTVLEERTEAQIRLQVRTRLRQLIAGGHHDQARLLKAWISKMFAWAAGQEIIARSPLANLDIAIQKTKRSRFFSDDEIKAIWRAADQLEPEEGTFVKLVMLLAPRKIALAAMTSSDLDSLDTPTVWETPFDLVKARKTTREERVYLTPLPPLAQRLFKRVAKEGQIFPSLQVYTTVAGRQIFQSDGLKRKLIELGAPADFKFHVARHTVATWLKKQGYSLFERGLILNHAESGVTGGYSHGHATKLKLQLLIEWADHVAALVQPAGAALLA
jgi:integrase